MEAVTTIFVFLVVVATCQTNAYSKPEIYNNGDNATVLIEKLPTDGIKSWEIFFSGFTQKLHAIHMIIIEPITNNENYIQVSRYYSGRIEDININNGSITFLLLNVNLMDSGNYTVFEGTLAKGKRSILVTRRILTGHVAKPMILLFVCNNTNTSSIKIAKSYVFDYVDYIIYDVARKSCAYDNVSQKYWDRIDSCVLNDTNFNLILRELRWYDKDVYSAWDDQGLLLDSIFVGITDNDISTPRGAFSTDSSCHREQNDYESVYYFEGKLIWLLVSAVVNIRLLSCLAFIAVRKFRHREGQKTKEEEISCSDQDQRMFRTSHTVLKRNDDDERKYEEPRSNDMELTAYLEPISQPVNIYQRLHPYENQGNNMYRSLQPENII